MSPRTGNLLIVFLALGLVLSSVFSASILQSLQYDIGLPGQPKATFSPVPIRYGVLSVSVFLQVTASNLSANQVFQPIPNEHIWLSLPDHELTRLLFLFTDQTGSVRIQLLAGSYLIEIYDSHFQAQIPVQVYGGNQTQLSVYGNRFEQPVVFEDFAGAAQPGLVPNLGTIFVAVHSASVIGNQTGYVFMEGRGSSQPGSGADSISTGRGDQIEARVLNQQLENGVLWLQLIPLHPLNTASYPISRIVAYTLNYKITVNSDVGQLAPINNGLFPSPT